MGNIKLEAFSGMAPKVLPTQLPDNMATLAVNTRFDKGGLVPWRGYGPQIQAVSGFNLRSLYFFEGAWLTSSYPRQYVESLQPADGYNRLYFTDNNYPKVYYQGVSYRLGLPRPATPGATITTPGDKTDPVDVRNQSYVVTIVDAIGVEGPSSVPTASYEVGEGGVVLLDLSPCVISGNYNLGAGALFRIYRTNTGSDGAIFQYVAEVPYGTLSYSDSVPPSMLQEELQSATWVGPPNDNTTLFPYGPLASMVEYPGGILAGHSGKTVYLSVPYVPSAWPYSYTFADEVVNVVVIQGGLLVLTKGKPHLLTGSSPDALADIPIESTESCVAARSVVDMGLYAAYASPRGLVLGEGNTVSLVTDPMFDNETWQSFIGDLSLIRAGLYQGKYIAFYGTEAQLKGFIYDPQGEQGAFIQLSLDAAAMYTSLDDGRMYMLRKLAGLGEYEIVEFGVGNYLPATWVSKEFWYPNAVGFGAVRVQYSGATCKFRVSTDGVDRPLLTLDGNNGAPFRLAAGYRARKWQMHISMFERLEWVQVAESIGELD